MTFSMEYVNVTKILLQNTKTMTLVKQFVQKNVKMEDMNVSANLFSEEKQTHQWFTNMQKLVDLHITSLS